MASNSEYEQRDFFLDNWRQDGIINYMKNAPFEYEKSPVNNELKEELEFYLSIFKENT